MHFDSVTKICDLINGHKIRVCDSFFKQALSFRLHFFRDNLDWQAARFDEGICFPNSGCHENREKKFFGHGNGYLEEK